MNYPIKFTLTLKTEYLTKYILFEGVYFSNLYNQNNPVYHHKKPLPLCNSSLCKDEEGKEFYKTSHSDIIKAGYSISPNIKL